MLTMADETVSSRAENFTQDNTFWKASAEVEVYSQEAGKLPIMASPNEKISVVLFVK